MWWQSNMNRMDFYAFFVGLFHSATKQTHISTKTKEASSIQHPELVLSYSSITQHPLTLFLLGIWTKLTLSLLDSAHKLHDWRAATNLSWICQSAFWNPSEILLRQILFCFLEKCPEWMKHDFNKKINDICPEIAEGKTVSLFLLFTNVCMYDPELQKPNCSVNLFTFRLLCLCSQAVWRSVLLCP